MSGRNGWIAAAGLLICAVMGTPAVAQNNPSDWHYPEAALDLPGIFDRQPPVSAPMRQKADFALMAAMFRVGDAQEGGEDGGISDPLETWNRWMFTFNDRFYFWVFRPFSEGWNWFFPEELRVGFRKFFHNLAMPVRFVNNTFQAKFQQAGVEILRFLVNSTLGCFGFSDFAGDELKLKSNNEDTGQTLGFYGMDHGLYIIWPFLGPSSLRDTVGMAGDAAMDPLTWVLASEWNLIMRAYEYTNEGSLRIGEYEDFKKGALDPYLAMRDAYYQYRKRQVAQ